MPKNKQLRIKRNVTRFLKFGNENNARMRSISRLYKTEGVIKSYNDYKSITNFYSYNYTRMDWLKSFKRIRERLYIKSDEVNVYIRIFFNRSNLFITSYYYDTSDFKKRFSYDLFFMTVGYLKKYFKNKFIKKKDRYKYTLFQIYSKFFEKITGFKINFYIKNSIKHLGTYLNMFKNVGYINFMNPKPYALLKTKKRRSIKRKLRKKITEES